LSFHDALIVASAIENRLRHPLTPKICSTVAPLVGLPSSTRFSKAHRERPGVVAEVAHTLSRQKTKFPELIST